MRLSVLLCPAPNPLCQDAYAISSYKRAQAAQQQGSFKAEIAPVEVKGKSMRAVSRPPSLIPLPLCLSAIAADDEPTRVDFAKIPKLSSGTLLGVLCCWC